MFLLYARTFPVLALNEVKTILRATGEFGVKNNNVHHHASGHDHNSSNEGINDIKV